MFFPMGEAIVDSQAVDWIEWRKERFVLHIGRQALAYPISLSGQANALAKGFLKAHNGDLVNPARIYWAERLGYQYVVYLETSSHSITDAEQMKKLETWLNRKTRRAK